MTSSSDLLALGEHTVELARELGVQEAAAVASRGVAYELDQREGRLEKCQESRSRSLRVRLLVDDRFSSHATSDLRPDALRAFLERAVAATRHLEPDENRRLPPAEQMGCADVDALDLRDPDWDSFDAADRRKRVEAIEEQARALAAGDPLRSVTAYLWDARSERAMVCSNGFAGGWVETVYGHGASVSLVDAEGRVPEASFFLSARHFADLPGTDRVAREATLRARRRLGSGPTESGRYPVIFENRVVGRLLGTLLGPMEGENVYEGRSCLAEKLGERIGAAGFDLVDDPLLPRALGSRPFDGDGRPAHRLPLIEGGVLRNLLIDVYNGRRLGRPPTIAGTSNLVVPPGERSWRAIAADWDTALFVEGFLGGDTNPATGDFSFGIRGQLLKRGEPVSAVSEMNVTSNIFELLERFREAADDPWRYGSWRTPSLAFDGLQFSGTSGPA